MEIIIYQGIMSFMLFVAFIWAVRKAKFAQLECRKAWEKLDVLESSAENLETLLDDMSSELNDMSSKLNDMSSENKRLRFENAVKDTVINNLKDQNFKMSDALNKHKITW